MPDPFSPVIPTISPGLDGERRPPQDLRASELLVHSLDIQHRYQATSLGVKVWATQAPMSSRSMGIGIAFARGTIDGAGYPIYTQDSRETLGRLEPFIR